MQKKRRYEKNSERRNQEKKTDDFSPHISALLSLSLSLSAS
jgi:hypothetical protein